LCAYGLKSKNVKFDQSYAKEGQHI
jgi:hypothetical protein